MWGDILSLSLMSFLLHVHTYSHHLSSHLFTYLPTQPSTISHQRPQFFVYCVTIFSCTYLLIPLYVKSSCPRISVTREKSPNVHKSCPKEISLEKLKILAPTQKLPKTVGDLGKLIIAKGFKSCPKSNKSPNLVTLTKTHLLLFTYSCVFQLCRACFFQTIQLLLNLS